MCDVIKFPTKEINLTEDEKQFLSDEFDDLETSNFPCLQLLY